MKTDRVNHFLQAVKKTSFPQRMIFFDTETYRIRLDSKTEQNILKLGWATCLSVSDNTMIDEKEFTTADQLWDFVIDNMHGKSATWVLCHFSRFDFPVVEFDRQLRRRGFTFDHKKSYYNQAFRVVYRHPVEGLLYLVDTMNWFHCSVRQLGEDLGFPKGEFDYNKIEYVQPNTEEWTQLSQYCYRDTQIIAKAVIELCDIIRQHRLGSLTFTAGKQAMNAFRHRFLPAEGKEITITDDARVNALERESYHGGVVHQWGSREVKNIYICDFTSMYPSVMKGNLYPYRIFNRRAPRFWSCDSVLRSIKKGWCFTAQVTVDIPRGQFIVPGPGRIHFPDGKFTTTLTTPEIALVAELGMLTDIHQMICYYSAPLFDDYINEMFSMRSKYLAEGKSSYANLIKMLMNSLAGKFGQRISVWEPVDSRSADMFIRPHLDSDQSIDDITFDSQPVRYADEGFEVQSSTRFHETADSFPGIAAHVNAYARCKLLEHRALIGPENVVYADTDSLFLTERGYTKSKSLGLVSDKKELGTLYCDPTQDYFTHGKIFGPKNYVLYRADGSEKNKHNGIRANAEEIETGVYQQDKIPGWGWMFNKSELNRSLVFLQEKHTARAL